MNNMLYIIAGLVIILIVVVLVLIRKKAQEPSAPPQLQDAPKAKDTAATPKHVEMAKKSAPVATTDSSATKFDNLTVAQRFMDQQRYDKAIETLERGLIAQPNDSQLLLKLLNIYAITDAEAEFNSTFAIITAHADSETIKQAKNLKGLVDEEFEQEQAIIAPTDTDENDDYATLDFDLPVAQTQTAQPTTEAVEELAPIAAPSASKPVDVSTTSAMSDDAFDLILDGLDDLDGLNDLDNLEDTTPVTQAPDTMPTATSADNDLPVADSPVIETPVSDAKTDNYAADNIDDDFSFNFDDLSEDASTADIVTADAITDKSVEEPNEFDLTDDAFVLDFDDLTAETEISTEASTKDADTAMAHTEDHDIAITAPVAQDSLEDDFTLFLDDAELDAMDEPTVSSPSTTDAPIETPLEDDFLDSTLLDSTLLDNKAVDNEFSNADSLPTETLATDETLATEDLETDNVDTSPVETAVLGSSVEDTIAQLDALTLNDTLDTDIEEPIADNQPQDNELSDHAAAPVSDSHDFADVEPSLSEPALEDNDSTLSFDDDTGFEDLDFSFDAVTETPVAAPVTVEETRAPAIQDSDIQPSDTVPVTGISQQFSADFDFIKTLDSQQVTLDLAEQYLELGEYDSAKRLLNEVVTQGNSEQQQQAKALLTRTA